MGAPSLSLIIPAYNEAELLPRMLASVAAARQRCEVPVELIVADNQSTDATAELARAGGARVARVEKRCIAASRNGGAAAAGGDILCFVDADSSIHPLSLQRIHERMQDSRAVGGATGVVMETWSAGIATTYALMLPMVWLSGFDSGIVFCRRQDFTALGGYDESLLVAEDVDFLVRLKRLGRSRSQKLVRLKGVKTVTSTRKFVRYGDWHVFREMPGFAWHALTDRKSLERKLRKYWYESR